MLVVDCDGLRLVDGGGMVVAGGLPKVSCASDGFPRTSVRMAKGETNWFRKSLRQESCSRLEGAMALDVRYSRKRRI